MHGKRLILAVLLFAPATAAADEQRSATPLTGLAGLAAYEAAAYPTAPQLPKRSAKPVRTTSRDLSKLTGLAGLAARESMSWRVSASRSSSPTAGRKARANSALQDVALPGVRVRFKPTAGRLLHLRGVAVPGFRARFKPMRRGAPRAHR